MRFDLHIYYHHSRDEAPSCVADLKDRLDLIIQNQETIMSALDDLQAAVAAEDTVIDSAIALINGIPALIAAAGTDPAKLQALQADITSKSQALAAAVTANTPAPTP